MMKAGSLDSRITFKRKVSTKGSYGKEVAWVDSFSVWSGVEASINEKQSGDKTVTVHRYNILIRYRSDVKLDMKISVLGVDADIIAITPDKRKGAINIIAESAL